MTLQQLQYFVAVADTGNFTRAAEETYSTQPTLSRQIRMLESELGYDLFRRNRKPIQLTEAGRIFYDGIKSALQQIRYTQEIAHAAADGRSGTLRIGFLSSFYSEYLYLPILKDLKATCGGLHIICSKLGMEEQLQGLKDESVDVAITLEDKMYRAAGFDIYPLVSFPILVVMSADHPLASRTRLEDASMEGETFYLPHPLSTFGMQMIAEQENWQGHFRQIEVNSVEEAYMKVLAEDALTISNPYDPTLQNNSLYHSTALERSGTRMAAVVNPKNRNAAKNLLIELLKHADNRR